MRGSNGLLEVEYGEYPQKCVDERFAQILENKYLNNILGITGKRYTTNSNSKLTSSFEAFEHIEYEYGRRRYVRVPYNGSNTFRKVSTGQTYQNGDFAWVEVMPIKWLVDEKNDIMITKKLIFSGVQFKNKSDYTGNFEQTDIKKFMDKYFSKDMVSSYNYVHTEENQILSKTNKQPNPYNFSFENVSEEEIVKGAIESGIAVFLHGLSSDGKSARVKQLDPDCEVVYLGGGDIDAFVGKTVYNPEKGEMINIAPPWLKKVSKKCEEEPDKIHIIFFDEITHAHPSIQAKAYNVILDREVNGIWKLPDNARIAVAGNELKDSLAANELAEPLFNRCAHVYINTTVDSWLDWASTPSQEYQKLDYEKQDSPTHKIHPSIYAFVAYRRENVLRTPYNGEKPNADPRKWEMASKMLYKTNNPLMLKSLVGEEVATEFAQFCQQQVITLQDVIEGNYTENDFNMNLSEKYATAVALSYVDDNNFETVRNFMENLGPEFVSVFDNYWSRGSEERLLKIAEVRALAGVGGRGI